MLTIWFSYFNSRKGSIKFLYICMFTFQIYFKDAQNFSITQTSTQRAFNFIKHGNKIILGLYISRSQNRTNLVEISALLIFRLIEKTSIPIERHEQQKYNVDLKSQTTITNKFNSKSSRFVTFACIIVPLTMTFRACHLFDQLSFLIISLCCVFFFLVSCFAIARYCGYGYLVSSDFVITNRIVRSF